MLTGHGSIDTAIESIRVGAFDYVVKPCPLGELEVRIQRAIERRALRQRASLLERGLTPADLGRSFVGESAAFRQVLQLVERVAPADSTVLITGETGVGQGDRGEADPRAQPPPRPAVRGGRVRGAAGEPAAERAVRPRARRVHRRGPRQARAVRGGARRHDLPRRDWRGQPRDAGEAAARARHVHVPPRRAGRRRSAWTCGCIAATNRDLPAMVRQGLFREDLFYRLSTIAIAPAAAARDAGETWSCWPGTSWRASTSGAAAEANGGRGARRARAPRLAGQRARAVPRGRGGGDGVRRRRDSARASAGVGPAPAGRAARPAELPTLEAWSATTWRVLDVVHGHRAQAARILGISERNSTGSSATTAG